MSFSNLIYKWATGELKLERQMMQERRDLMQLQSNRQRMQLYAGAEPGINRPSPNILSTPEDYKPAYERIILIRYARQLEEDYPFFDGILNDFETYVVGELDYMPATGNADADRKIKDYLDWQFDQCDISERLDLVKMARLWVRS